MAARRSLVAAALALLWLGAAAAPGYPGATLAANPWTLSLTPSTLTLGVPTNITATVTDGSEEIGCVVFYVPSGFTVLSASVSSVPAGFVWSAAVAGSGPTRVTFSTTKDPWRLNGATGRGVFVIRVVATAGPLPAWTAAAYKKFTVDSKQLASGPLPAPGPFTITPTANPTPAPTATPTPPATPAPPAGGSPGPTAGASPSSTPASPVDSAAPSESPLASASPGSDAGTAAQTPAAGSGGVATGGGGTTAAGDTISLDVRELPVGGTVQLDSQVVGGIGMFVWMVPGLFMSLPGLLLLLIVVAQGGIATIFIPVTRRVLGSGRRRRRRGHPAPAA